MNDTAKKHFLVVRVGIRIETHRITDISLCTGDDLFCTLACCITSGEVWAYARDRRKKIIVNKEERRKIKWSDKTREYTQENMHPHTHIQTYTETKTASKAENGGKKPKKL